MENVSKRAFLRQAQIDPKAKLHGDGFGDNPIAGSGRTGAEPRSPCDPSLALNKRRCHQPPHQPLKCAAGRSAVAPRQWNDRETGQKLDVLAMVSEPGPSA